VATVDAPQQRREPLMQNDDFWRQVQEHEQQMYEFEMRMQNFKSSVAEVMEAEAKANKALSDALQACLREIDIVLNKVNQRGDLQ
jgi:hypothetical protein